MKVIKQILTGFSLINDELTFENKVLLSTSLYAGLLCLISVFADIISKLGIGAVVIVGISSIIYLSIFIYGYFHQKFAVTKRYFSIYSILFCNFYWIVNYGSRGSGLYLFVVYYAIMVFIWDNLQIRLFTFLTIVNILLLFGLELINPRILPAYPSELGRIFDSYITLLMIIGFFSIIIVSAKNNYIKQYKMAQRSDKLKSAFLANMSHEIRTPLNAIMGFTKLFTTRDLPKEKKEHYSRLITENSKYLMQLLSDILDISLIESGQLKITSSTISLQNFFNKLYENQIYTLAEMGKSDVQLMLNIPSEENFIVSDEIRLEQIMSNLINNAIKFTSQGYIKFGYYLQENELVFFVEDTGIGIKEEFQPEIFNRFVKNEDNRDINFVRGAGIGLSLTKELVQVLGGKIWFTSAYQEGSTFFLSLPDKLIHLQGKPH